MSAWRPEDAVAAALAVMLGVGAGTAAAWPLGACMRRHALPPPAPPARAQVEVAVSATVLSRKKGKPALRPHVRCVGQAADTDTEAASDWAGF